MNKFLLLLSSHLNLIPAITAAVQTFQAIGHSKESTLQKIVEIVDASAHVAQDVPVPLVQQIGATAAVIVEGVFGQSTTPTPKPATP